MILQNGKTQVRKQLEYIFQTTIKFDKGMSIANSGSNSFKELQQEQEELFDDGIRKDLKNKIRSTLKAIKVVGKASGENLVKSN